MYGLRSLLFNISFALNVLLVFFVVFGAGMVVPAWLQVVGRMHPLVLHFPIVLIIVYVGWLLVARQNSHYRQFADGLLLTAAFTAAFTALCGLLLSKEPGYDADMLRFHEYTGTATSIILLLWYSYNRKQQIQSWRSLSFSILLIVLVTVTGHLGASITHGENFVMAPVTTIVKTVVPFDDAYVYADLVQPILNAKCIGCHNSSKAKGQLVLETAETLLKGGKNGKLFDTSVAGSLLWKRLQLAEEEKEHMPPAGKPQLTPTELAIIKGWINNGSDVHTRAADLAYNDTLRLLAYKQLRGVEETYTFPAADMLTIEKLKTASRVIYPVAINSPALVVNFYDGKSFRPESLKELSAVRTQVVELNLNNMPVGDKELDAIAGFENLRHLSLNNTLVTGDNFQKLQGLHFLKTLSLSGAPLKVKNLPVLQTFAKLRTVYVWNTPAEFAALPAGKVQFEKGYNGSSVVLQLTPPIVVNDETVIGNEPIELKHYIKGTTIRYTIDGSEPDSIASPVYKNAIAAKNGLLIKARAVKQGWYSSEVSSRFVFSGKFKPDSAILLQPADEKYRAKNAGTLIDCVKSDVSPGSGKWLGYRSNNFEALLLFNDTIMASSVTISALQKAGSYIFPPSVVEVWGGTNNKNMQLLSKINPAQPAKDQPDSAIPLTTSFKAAKVNCLKVVARPLAHLPEWHPAKGEKAWFFVDEVLVN